MVFSSVLNEINVTDSLTVPKPDKPIKFEDIREVSDKNDIYFYCNLT